METKRVIRQNEQIHNFYGRRSNSFLLQGYNFAMDNNQYDSYSFRLIINTKNKSKVLLEKLINLNNTVNSVLTK